VPDEDDGAMVEATPDACEACGERFASRTRYLEHEEDHRATALLELRLAERAQELFTLVADATDELIALHWQLVALDVRSVVPEATGLRCYGERNEDWLPRLHLREVLVDGQPVELDDDHLTRLEDLLDDSESLMEIAEREDEGIILGLHDHDLPMVNAEDGLRLVVPLLEGAEARLFAPDPEEGDPGPMYVLDALGVAVRVRQRPDGDVFVHVDDSDQTQAPAGATTLLVEVRTAGEQEHPL
jgi:hypothetical protein